MSASASLDNKLKLQYIIDCVSRSPHHRWVKYWGEKLLAPTRAGVKEAPASWVRAHAKGARGKGRGGPIDASSRVGVRNPSGRIGAESKKGSLEHRQK